MADLGGQHVALAWLGLEHPPEPRLALALAILRSSIEIVDADPIGCLDDCIGRFIADTDEALSQRGAPEAEAGDLDIAAAEAPTFTRIQDLPPNATSTALVRSYTVKSYTI